MEAIDEFTAAILIDPDLDSVFLQRSISNYEEGFMEAVNDADEAVKRSQPHAHYYRAKGYAFTGEV